jgi:hypothetical protein
MKKKKSQKLKLKPKNNLSRFTNQLLKRKLKRKKRFLQAFLIRLRKK